MKVLKIFAYNLIGLVVLFVILELFCRMTGVEFFKTEPYRDIVDSRFKNQPMEDFGSSALLNPPASLSSENDSLKSYTYADIDQTPVQNRQWTVSSDGFVRSARFIKKIKGTDKEVYNVIYRMNPWSKRIVENQANKDRSTSFVLTAGDSYTFGEGVNQGQDYPSQLASLLSPDWFVYNYGISGDSANDLAYRSTIDSQFFAPLKESHGIFIWIYNDAQMQRLVYPTTAYTFSYIAKKAEYTLSDGDLIFHGYFNNSNRMARKLINGMAALSLTRAFHLELPKVYTQNHYELFITLLNASLSSLEQTGKKIDKKILVLYTSHYKTEELKRTAIENGFEVLDFEKLLYKRDKNFGGNLSLSLPVDGHPSPEAYWLLARVLKEKYFK